ncbi:unnamed protein product [Protopolystoma xenopodis]|uniref:Uncharacterized protein n=1 Tax=Protopolystoma xenopodis TaxID=117903 RepID=A0A448XSW2_9PLAT|nr:unnamed protein product [Protopolystoma xenopodis]
MRSNLSRCDSFFILTNNKTLSIVLTTDQNACFSNPLLRAGLPVHSIIPLISSPRPSLSEPPGSSRPASTPFLSPRSPSIWPAVSSSPAGWMLQRNGWIRPPNLATITPSLPSSDHLETQNHVIFLFLLLFFLFFAACFFASGTSTSSLPGLWRWTNCL